MCLTDYAICQASHGCHRRSDVVACRHTVLPFCQFSWTSLALSRGQLSVLLHLQYPLPSQVIPVHPEMQEHKKSSPSISHTPPWWHGLGWQLSRSIAVQRRKWRTDISFNFFFCHVVDEKFTSSDYQSVLSWSTSKVRYAKKVVCKEPASASIGHAMLMRPNKVETAVHGCLTFAWVIWLYACVRWKTHGMV